MARIRTIKPTFFTSLTISDLSLHARLTFIGLWTHCDDEGRCLADPRLIRAAIWPLEDRPLEDVRSDLGALRESSLITLYEVAGRHYIAINGWSEHQKISNATKSKLPSPEDGRSIPPTSPNGHSRRTPGGLPEDSSQEGKGREQGTGNGVPPSAGDFAPQPRALAAVPDEPAAESADVVEPDEPPTAQTLLADWIDSCQKRPPNNVIGQVGKHLAALLAEGQDADDVRAGLVAWHNKALHPSTLPSVVNEVMNTATRQQAPRSRQAATQAHTDAMFDRAMQRAQAREAAGQ